MPIQLCYYHREDVTPKLRSFKFIRLKLLNFPPHCQCWEKLYFRADRRTSLPSMRFTSSLIFRFSGTLSICSRRSYKDCMFGHSDSNRFASCRIAMASRESETGILILTSVLRKKDRPPCRCGSSPVAITLSPVSRTSAETRHEG